MIKIPITVEMTPTVEELASEFAFLSDLEQAEFIIRITNIMRNWGVHDYNMQLLEIIDSLDGINTIVDDIYELKKMNKSIILKEKIMYKVRVKIYGIVNGVHGELIVDSPKSTITEAANSVKTIISNKFQGSNVEVLGVNKDEDY